MRKKLVALLLSTAIAVAAVAPAWACTPPLSPPKLPDLEKAYEACREAGKKAAENVVIPDSYFKNETESETETETELETETAVETETEMVLPEKHYLDWSKYIPESFRNRWMSFVRR